MVDAVRKFPRALLAILLLAAALRLAIALASIGTNDVSLWQQFGRGATVGAFHELWANDRWVNHPPLPVAYARLCYAIAGDGRYAFSLLIKLPGFLADLASTALIWQIVRARLGDRAAGVAATLYAINPTALILTGYHGNLDPLLAFLNLLTWHLAARGRSAGAAAALGAGINVKLAPAPSAALLLATVRSRRELASMLAALAIAALPFAWMTIVAGQPFVEGVFGYRPMGSAWLTVVPAMLQTHATLAPVATWLTLTHAATILPVSLLWLLALAVRHRRHGGDVLTLGALFWCGLLVWTGGGFQYAIWPLPLLAALRPRLAFAYGIAAGVWLAASYAWAWTGTLPPETFFLAEPPPKVRLLMLAPMLMLLAATVSLWRSRSAPTA